jgi:hypothetical protein
MYIKDIKWFTSEEQLMVNHVEIKQNTTVLQRDIFRLAALLYSETTEKSNDTKLYIIECILAQNQNDWMTFDEIINRVSDSYKLFLTFEELDTITQTSKNIFEKATIDSDCKYRLAKSAYETITVALSKTIDYYIDLYIEEYEIPQPELCKDSIYKYIYELTTTNINSYKILLNNPSGNSFRDDELSINVNDFDDDSVTYVEDFLNWDNGEKNVVVSNIVYCCLEYCLLISGDSLNTYIVRTMKEREIYLDTNIIFRALGLNGVHRKKVIDAFLSKCKQAKINIKISRFTKNEFRQTVDYYVQKITEFPRGKVFRGAYERLTDYNLFSFYSDWASSHNGLSISYFRSFIDSLYATVLKTYSIIDDEETPYALYNSDEFQKEREKYAGAIYETKNKHDNTWDLSDIPSTGQDKHDASVIRLIELYRENIDVPSKIFFVSSDKILRYWDMTRNNKYPVVIYPSQLFLILIKMCGRSSNDFDSFVSFINIRSHKQQLTSDKANIIISAISSITEDMNSQEYLVQSVFENNFQDILKQGLSDTELYETAQTISQNYLQSELEAQKESLSKANSTIDSLGCKISNLEGEISNIKETKTNELESSKQELSNQANKIEEQKDRISKFAEKKITSSFLFYWYILPVIILLWTVIVITFIAFQFFFKNESWNFSLFMLKWIDTTAFGEFSGEGSVIAIDTFLGGAFIALLVKFKNVFLNRDSKMEDKLKRIQRYITKHKLL